MHLQRILDRTRADLAVRKQTVPLKALREQAALHTPRGFAAALRTRAQQGPAMIAELKKASPSKGMIREGFDPEPLARTLTEAGAAVLSVLTDEPFFAGSLRNLELASAATSLPCLRKDFMVDEYQIIEAKAHKADAILLIAAALTDEELRHLRQIAREQQLDVLCEVHNGEELERVLDLDCEAYGVNNRDLKSFAVNLDVSLRLAERLPTGAVHVAESGIHTVEDLKGLRAAGFHAFLIGESLMRQPDPGQALSALLAPFQGL